MGEVSSKKYDTFKVCQALCLQLQGEQNKEIVRIRSDHGREFENVAFKGFCYAEGIIQKFLAPLTP